jgi:hypothetical protein
VFRVLIVPVVCGAVLLTGCATPAGGSQEEAYQAKEYRTGSNLPSRDSRTVQTQSVDQTMKALTPTSPIRSQ